MERSVLGAWLIVPVMMGALIGSAGGTERGHVPSAAVAHDGPFGIHMGEPLADLGPVVRDAANPTIYAVLHPPRVNPDFPIVGVTAYPSIGVCGITGTGSMIDDDPSGFKVRVEVDRLADLLRAKYGPSEKLDDCGDSTDDACGSSWALSRLQGDARYAYMWRNPAGARAQGILRIAVVSSAVSANSTRVEIGYDSANPACSTAAAGGL